jgi:hypothetical protein
MDEVTAATTGMAAAMTGVAAAMTGTVAAAMLAAVIGRHGSSNYDQLKVHANRVSCHRIHGIHWYCLLESLGLGYWCCCCHLHCLDCLQCPSWWSSVVVALS